MSNLEEAELRREAATEAVSAQITRIKTVESRLAEVESDLQNFDRLLKEAAFTDPDVDWSRYAVARLAMELEKSTLPSVVAQLKEPLPGLQSVAQRATREIERLMKESAEDAKVEKIREILDAGQTNRVIQSKIGLADHDFYRVLAKAKRPATADTQPV
jgi:hypothetical protein